MTMIAQWWHGRRSKAYGENWWLQWIEDYLTALVCCLDAGSQGCWPINQLIMRIISWVWIGHNIVMIECCVHCHKSGCFKQEYLVLGYSEDLRMNNYLGLHFFGQFLDWAKSYKFCMVTRWKLQEIAWYLWFLLRTFSAKVGFIAWWGWVKPLKKFHSNIQQNLNMCNHLPRAVIIII